MIPVTEIFLVAAALSAVALVPDFFKWLKGRCVSKGE